MIRKNSLGVVTFFVCLGSSHLSIATAQTPVPPPTAASASTAPKFEPVPGSIVNGLSGLVAATAGLSNYRFIQRTMVFRTALAEALKPGLDVSKPLTVAPSNALVLCSMRGRYAAMAAEMAYITTVTTALNQFAMPSTIATIGDAFKSVFQNYQIDASSGKMTLVDAASVVKNCQADIDAWPSSYYGASLGGVPMASTALSDVGAGLSTFGDLLTALSNIITPIATAAAQSLDSTRRAKEITSFLTNPKFQADLLAAANALATNGNILIQANRLQALGQFEEKMAAARTFKIDLSKIDACKMALAAPALAAPAPAPGGAAMPPPAQPSPSPFSNSDGTAFIPSDNFVSCYAQAWAQLNDVVQAVITAAAQYDTLADASSDQLINAVKAIQKNIGALKNPTVTVAQLVDAATQLLTVGKAVTVALSPENITTLQKAATNVMNLFK